MAAAFSEKKRSTSINRILVIIPAAGLGSRMNSEVNKQFLEIDGLPVIVRTLQAFQEFSRSLMASGIVLKAIVVTGKENVFKINSYIRYYGFDFVQSVVKGGDTRMESVWNGIEALDDLPFAPSDNDIVFIHDGARCLVDQDTLERCLDGALKYEICAAAVPVKSTIKITEPIAPLPIPELSKADNDMPAILRGSSIFKSTTPTPIAVNKTPKRDELMEVQTPQVFRYGKLVKSYVNAIKKDLDATDDTQLAEAMNYTVNLVEGSYSNIKITTPEDIIMAESLIRNFESEKQAKAEREAEEAARVQAEIEAKREAFMLQRTSRLNKPNDKGPTGFGRL